MGNLLDVSKDWLCQRKLRKGGGWGNGWQCLLLESSIEGNGLLIFLKLKKAVG